jgi:hypothetical protein
LTLALSADTWTQIIVAISIFGPLAVAIVLAVVILRGKKNDPDEQRMRAQQRAYEERQRSEASSSDEP